MNATKILLAQACAAVTLACAAITTSAAAGADPEPDPDVVCGMYDGGVPPAQIPDRVIQNQPRDNSPRLNWHVLHDLQNC
jgi:hypothetical protein